MDTNDIIGAALTALLVWFLGVIGGHLFAIHDYHVCKNAQWRLKRSLFNVWIWPAYVLWAMGKGFCQGCAKHFEALRWFYTGDKNGEQYP